MFHCGAEQVLNLAGEKIRLSRLVRRLMREWYEWALQQVRDPLEVVIEALPFIPSELQAAVITQADKDACKRYNLDHEQLDSLWQSPEGMLHAFGLLLLKYHPDKNPEVLFNLVADPSAVLLKASGRIFKSEMEHEQDYYREVGFLPPQDNKPSSLFATDWTALDRKMFQNFYVLPTELDEMTIPEIMAIAKAEEQVQAVDATEATIHAAVQQGLRYHWLTPLQKLELAMRKYAL